MLDFWSEVTQECSQFSHQLRYRVQRVKLEMEDTKSQVIVPCKQRPRSTWTLPITHSTHSTQSFVVNEIGRHHESTIDGIFEILVLRTCLLFSMRPSLHDNHGAKHSVSSLNSLQPVFFFTGNGTLLQRAQPFVSVVDVSVSPSPRQSECQSDTIQQS